MKKIITLVLMLSTGLFLAGCDLVGEDVIKDAQEDLCVTNPEHETCQPGAITIDEGLTAVEALIADYQNQNMSSTDVCAKYFDGIDDDCDGARDESLENGIMIELKLLDDDDDNDGIYNATLEITIDGEIETVEVQVQLTRLDSGEVQAKIIETEDEWQGSVEEVKIVFEQFIADYLDPDVDNDYFNNMYFAGEMAVDFGEDRARDLLEGTMISLVSLEEIPGRDDGFLLATLMFTIDGESNEMKLNIRVNRIEMAYRVELGDGIDNDCDGDCPITDIVELTEVFQMYINDYLNPQVTIEYIAQMYFEDYLPMEFENQRIKDLAGIETVEILSVDMIANEYGLFRVVLFIAENGMETTTEIDIRVNRIEMGYRLMFDEGIDNDCDGVEMCIDLDPTEVKEVLKEFYTDLYNPNVSDEYIAMTYFNYNIPFEIMMLREATMGMQISVDIVSVLLLTDDPQGFMIAEIDFTMEGVVNKENIKIKVKRIDASSVLLMFAEDDTDLIYDVLMRLESFFYDINMGTTTDETCSSLFDLESKALCDAVLTYHSENKYNVYIENIIMNDDGTLDIVLMTTDIDQMFIESNTFTVRFGGRNSIANPLYMESYQEGNNPLYSN